MIEHRKDQPLGTICHRRNKLSAIIAVTLLGGCAAESESATRSDGMGDSEGSANASGGQDGTGATLECNPEDVAVFCGTATALSSLTPGPGDCGQESTKPTGNVGHRTGCGFYQVSISDDAGQGEIRIYDGRTGHLVYYRKWHYARAPEVVTTEVGCEPACETWRVIPCSSSAMGGAAGQ